MSTPRRPYRSKHTHGPRAADTGLLCRECGLRKPVTEFRILATGSRESYCTDCHNARNRAWRAARKGAADA